MTRPGRFWRRRRGAAAVLPEISEEDRQLLEQVAPYTLTSPERRYAVIEAVRHIVRTGLDGAFVECGVWKGGSILAMLLTLQRLGRTDRDIWLYDTFEGMTEPQARDTSRFSAPAAEVWAAARASAKKAWSQLFAPEVFSLEDVRARLEATGYPRDRLHFVKGPVEQTLPREMPARIALLRLDTDWYESTRHELQHLYPRLASGGVLIVDDYGHWEGCRAAVDEYFATPGIQPVMLNRIDYTGRIAIKP